MCSPFSANLALSILYLFLYFIPSGKASLIGKFLHQIPFSESLIKGQEKVIRMGVIKTSKDQALLVTDSSKAQDKGKSKNKEPKEVDSNPEQNKQTSEEASSSKKKKEVQVSLLYEGFSSRRLVHEEDPRLDEISMCTE